MIKFKITIVGHLISMMNKYPILLYGE